MLLKPRFYRSKTMTAPNDSNDNEKPLPPEGAGNADARAESIPEKPGDSPQPGKGPKPGLKKKLLIAAGCLLSLLVVFYFVATSAFFVRSVALPKAGEILDAKISLGDASISPFSSVRFDSLEVAANGEEPVAKVGSISARYSLMDIIGGNINVQEVTVDSPEILLIVKEDGSTNLDPILKALESDEPPPPAGPTPNLDIRNVAIKNASIKLVQHLPGGAKQVVEIKNVNFDLDQLGNGKSGKINLAAALGLQTPTDQLSADFKGGFDVELGADLMPTLVSGKTSLGIADATGALEQAKGLNSELAVALTPTELKETSLKFSQNGRQLGQISVTGPFDAQKLSTDLTLAIESIDKNVLNIVGALAGLDFETTTLSSQSRVTLSPNAQMAVIKGGVKIDQFALTQITKDGRGPTTPAMDLGLDYDLSVDLTTQTAALTSLAVKGSNAKGPFLSGDLAAPVTASFGDTPKVTGDAAYKLRLTDFDLAPWKAFTGPSAPDGSVGLALDVAADEAGENIAVNFDVHFKQAANKPLQVNGDLQYSLPAATVALNALVDLKLSELKLPGAPEIPGDPVALKLETALKADLNNSSAAIAKLDVQASAGASQVIDGKLNKPLSVNWKDAVTAPGGANYKLNIVDFDLRHAKAFAGDAVPAGIVNFSLDLAADAAGSKLNVDYSGNLAQSGAKVAETSGKVAVDLATMAVDLKAAAKAELSKLQLADAPILPAEKNAAVNLTIDTAYDGKSVNLAKLETSFLEAGKQVTSLGLSGKIGLGDTITIDNTALQLAPTERAANKLTINGQVTPGELLAGNIDIKSDGLDVTPFMDLFMSEEAAKEQPAEEQPPAEQPPAPEQPKEEKEPDAIKLPIDKFNLDLAIATFYAREIAVSNYVTKVAIVGSKVNVNPFSLTFNGAPLSALADLNLGVPGYEYDVALKIDHLPIAPLVDTFSPEFKGKIAAEILTDVAIKGKGVTGVNLKEHLNGHAGMTLTNAALNVLEKGFLMKTVAAILQAPEILEPPLDYLNADLAIGNGSVDIQDFIVQSPAFQATATGAITLDDSLTNSALNIPIDISLSKNLAKNVKLTGVDPNAKYTPLPQFVSVGGTVGAHKVNLDRGKLLAVGIQAAPAAVLNAAGGAVGAAVDVTEKATQKLNKLTEGTVGGILGVLGDPSAKSDSKEASKQPTGLGGLLGGFGGKKKAASTNSPPKDATTSTNKAPGIKLPFNPFKK